MNHKKKMKNHEKSSSSSQTSNPNFQWRPTLVNFYLSCIEIAVCIYEVLILHRCHWDQCTSSVEEKHEETKNECEHRWQKLLKCPADVRSHTDYEVDNPQ
jgi:hypothetical protein